MLYSKISAGHSLVQRNVKSGMRFYAGLCRPTTSIEADMRLFEGIWYGLHNNPNAEVSRQVNPSKIKGFEW